MSNPALLTSTVKEALAIAKGGDGKRATSMIMRLIPDFTVEQILAAQADIDPHREFFEQRIGPNELGLHGLKLYDNQFICLSDLYGHNIDGYNGEYDEAFIDACETGFEDTSLHGNGNVVYDLAGKRFGFLMQVALEDHQVPVSSDIEELSAKHGVEYQAIAFPHQPICSLYPCKASASIVCLITDTSLFKNVPEMTSDVQDVVDTW